MKVAVVGSGSVGSALADGATRAGFEVRVGSRRADATSSIVDVVAWADVTVLAIPGGAVVEFASALGSQWLTGCHRRDEQHAAVDAVTGLWFNLAFGQHHDRRIAYNGTKLKPGRGQPASRRSALRNAWPLGVPTPLMVS